MIVDTHTHLQFAAFDADRAEVLARARAAGVGKLVVIGTDLADSAAAVALAAEYPGFLYATVGVHPNAGNGWDSSTLGELRRLAAAPQVVAIGEIGLDFYRDHCPHDRQREVFRAQQELALELGLPLVLHSRAAIEALDEELARGGGYDGALVVHCFTSHPELAGRFLDRGAYLGLDGPVTYPKAVECHEVARLVPLDRLVLETDCPFLAPQGLRGRRCEPAHLLQVAEAIAAQKGITLDEVSAATTANAAALFGWST